MPIRQHETVAVGPNGIEWIETHRLVPDRINEWCKSHGRAGMPGLRLLNGVHRERANCVDGQLIQLFSGHRACGSLFENGGFTHIFASKPTLAPSFSAAPLSATIRAVS